MRRLLRGMGEWGGMGMEMGLGLGVRVPGLTALPEREEVVEYTAEGAQGRIGGVGMGPGQIVMTREWRVRGE